MTMGIMMKKIWWLLPVGLFLTMLFLNLMGSGAGTITAQNDILNFAPAVFYDDLSTPTPTPIASPTPTPQPTPFVPLGEEYYVSKNGNNGNGLSWSTAWNELDQIDWEILEPGDVVYLDGGSSSMTYSTGILAASSGTSSAPITIRLSQDSGRNGQAIFFGGRGTALPYCGQASYNYIESTEDWGFRTGRNSQDPTTHHSHLVLDGTKWEGIVIHGYGRAGFRTERGSTNIVGRNLEIYDNGRAYQSGGVWYPDYPGIRLGGSGHTLERLIVHDNGQDAIQSMGGDDNNLGDITIRSSWLYNGRAHPTEAGNSFNNCRHTDGIQINSGVVVENINVFDTIIGPGFMQGVILGQSAEASSSDNQAEVNDVTFRNVLFMKATGNNIFGYIDVPSKNWTLDRVTAHCPTTSGNCIYLEGSGHVIYNSIFEGWIDTADQNSIHGVIRVPGDTTIGNNCQYPNNPALSIIGQIAEANFASVSDHIDDVLSLDEDYTVLSGACQNKGATLTSAEQLFSSR